MKEGVILLGHGSKRNEANEEMRELGRMVANNLDDLMCEVAFLTFGEPDLSKAVERLVDGKAEQIIIAPVFLVTGNHIKKDIPAKVRQEKEKYPWINFVTVDHFGPHPVLVGLICEKIKEAGGCYGNNLES